MAHWSSEVAAYLATQGVGTVGTNLFWGVLPPTPQSAVAVVPYGGPPPEGRLGAEGVTFETVRGQVVVRGAPGDASASLTLAQTAYVAIAQKGMATLSGTQYYWIHALSSPFLRGIDAAGCVEVAFNFEAMKALSA